MTAEVNRKSRELLIDRKSRAILVHSNASKHKFPMIYHFALENLDKDAYEIDQILKALPQNDIIIMNDILPSVLSLCNQPNNKWVYNIKNKLNGKKMNVGSTCINEFALIQLHVKKSRAELEKEALRKSRLQKLTLHIPGIEKQINEWNYVLDDYELLIPLVFEEQFGKLQEEIRHIYEDYLNGKIKNLPYIVNMIKKIIQRRDSLISKMNSYVKHNKLSRYIVTRDIVNWLKQHNDTETVTRLKETGRITSKTAPHIHEQGFLAKFIEDINQDLHKIGVEIVGQNHQKNGFIIQFTKSRIVKLCYPYRKFITYYGSYVFKDDPKFAITPNNIVIGSRINDESSLQLITSMLQEKLKMSRYSITFSMHDYDYFERNELDIIDGRRGKVTVLNLRDFAEEFKRLALGISHQSVKDVESYIELTPNLKFYSREDLEEIRKQGSKIRN